MSDQDEHQEPPTKRARLGGSRIEVATDGRLGPQLQSLTEPISPPFSRGCIKSDQALPTVQPSVLITSPFQLTRIQDLPAAENVDTVTLKDILGHPLIAECWEFNYLHDIDLLMSAFDEDVRDLVKVHVIHGFWKQEDAASIKMQAEQYQNVTLHTPYMPEMFGTHHTKMIVLLRHDDFAQIIIHTANLIRQDWRNLTQAVWRSPLLPLSLPSAAEVLEPSVGSGAKFKIDFVNYLRAYDTRRPNCVHLIEQLQKYDFSEIRGALIGSIPGRHSIESNGNTKWGWQALKHVLSSVPVYPGGEPEVVAQVSSIATLGATDNWLCKTLFGALSTTSSRISKEPKQKIIFPTPDEIRRSLDGYKSGASIHTKIQSPTQKKQLDYLKPMLYRWAGDEIRPSAVETSEVLKAGRKRAAPHIKTYVRFADAEKTRIDWALVTSANISKQAWGEARNLAGQVRICSFELGVLVWPGLFDEDARMVPIFKKDIPSLPVSADGRDSKVLIGFRMPYDIPIIKYSDADEPWCVTASYEEPDWMGMKWQR